MAEVCKGRQHVLVPTLQISDLADQSHLTEPPTTSRKFVQITGMQRPSRCHNSTKSLPRCAKRCKTLTEDDELEATRAFFDSKKLRTDGQGFDDRSPNRFSVHMRIWLGMNAEVEQVVDGATVVVSKVATVEVERAPRFTNRTRFPSPRPKHRKSLGIENLSLSNGEEEATPTQMCSRLSWSPKLEVIGEHE